jgi:hypothetical protein
MVTFSHGVEETDFSTYLNTIDMWLMDKIAAYNQKFNKSLTYESCFQAPMKKDENGELVINQEALDRYGHSTTVNVYKTNSKCLLHLEYNDKKTNRVDEFDFEGLVHPGARIKCILRPNIWIKDNVVTFMPTMIRVKVFESSYDSIVLDEDVLCKSNTNPFETLDL